jgi:signal transduction histidine kinase
LTNILLAAEQLQEMESKNPESTELLRLINRNATRINQLVSELLNATRFVNLQFETASLNDLVEETLAMAKDRIELNRVTVEKIYEQGICNVAVDREKIKVAFLNIIVNALEAMDKGVGVLQIKTRRLGGKCILEVRDNGKGMTEETIQKLFEPYFTNKPKGTGLGLTNTQNIVLNHHGKITVTSSPGSGSQFTIILDFAKEATA